MTDERTIDRLIAHLRAHVAALQGMESRGARAEEIAERQRVILRLQAHLADRVVGQLGAPC